MRLSRVAPATYLAAIVLINAYVAAGLFRLEYSRDMSSVEGSYMSISRFLATHPHDHTWMPWWFTGMPMNNLYPPAFHAAVAWIASLFSVSFARSFHMVVALVYVLGPVSLFFLVGHFTRSWRCAFAASLAYSLTSVSSLLVPEIAADAGGVLMPRRYQVLVHYGDGPHMAVLALIPLVILALDLAVSTRRRWMPLVAALSISVIALTNWPGSVELLLAIAAYAISRLFASPQPRWLAMIGIGALAYLVASPWSAPSTILAVSKHAQESDLMSFHAAHVVGAIAISGALIAIRWALARARAPRHVAFFAMLFLLTACMVFAFYWFGIKLSPQATRTHILMELSAVGLIATAVHAASRPIGPRAWIAVLVLLTFGAVIQARNHKAYAGRITVPIDIRQTDEYRISEWLRIHAHDARVFVPGSVSIWMNLFNDIPQLAGCCDPGVPTFEHRIALYTLYTDTNAGGRAAWYSQLWLRAYGVSQIAMVGTKSGEAYKPYQHPAKFEGVLPALWREGDNTIYRVTDDASLVHLVREDAIVRVPPIHGLDVDNLQKYVDGLDAAAYPHPSLTWTSAHSATVRGTIPAGHVLSVQVSWDPGWRASAAGQDVSLTPDALGLTVLHARCESACTIELRYEDPWRTATRIASCFGLLALIAWVVLTPAGPCHLPPPAA